MCESVFGGWGRHRIIHQLVNMDFFFFYLPCLYFETVEMFEWKSSHLKWTELESNGREKKRWCQHNLRAGKTITTSASVYINPADAKHFPIFAWLAFYFNAWGETVEAILLVADFLFFYCWPSNLYKFKRAGGNCVVCMLNPCANSDLLLGELNENAFAFSVSKERYVFLFFSFIDLNDF